MVSNTALFQPSVKCSFRHPGQFGYKLILSETPDGEVVLYPNEDSQIRLAVWDFGLATAQDASALNRLGKLLNSASTLAELIASQE